jgi:mRNA deadenylase 3'-5' endonuclease subunit Ccr4
MCAFHLVVYSLCTKTEILGELIVVNTHIYWNPRKAEVKLAQVSFLLREIEAIVKASNGSPCILCGDFNALPGSDIMKLIERGHVVPEQTSSPDRLLCDSSLDTMCTWLRILGVDTAKETKEEAHRRT